METKTELNVPPGAYMSIGSNALNLNKLQSEEYNLQIINSIWKDQAASKGGIKTFQRNVYTIPVQEAQLNDSMYTIAYAYLKTLYPNTTDA